MMKKLLLVVWCVKLADEKPLHPEFTAQYIFSSSKSMRSPSIKFSPIVKQTISKNKMNEPDFAAAISFSAPEEFDSSNHESGYSVLSKTFTKTKKEGKDDNSKYILDKRVLYHSLTNPLFKSKALNFEDENDSHRSVGDIYKITSPFESKWILSPKLTKLVDEKRSHLVDEFLNIFNSMKGGGLQDRRPKAIEPSSDSLFPAPSNLDLERYNNKLGGDTVDELENLGKEQFNENIKDSANIFKDFKDELIFKNLDEKPHLNDGATLPKNSSYVGYNVQEVKTPKGVQGVMQIFDKNGLAQKIHYDENGVLHQSAVNSAIPKIDKSASGIEKNTTDSKLHTAVKSAVNQPKPKTVDKSVLQKNDAAMKKSREVIPKKTPVPEVKQVSVKIEGHNFSKNGSRNNAIDELKNPENILSDFLNQLNGVSDVSNNANVRTDVHNSFHETISEKSYSYI